MARSSSPLSYKFQRLRESIRSAVEKGEFPDKLPGERELARRFGVNAKTISKALTDLMSEGLLVRHVGRGTFVTGRDQEGAKRGVTRGYAWITSEDVNQTFSDTMLEMARLRMQENHAKISSYRVTSNEDGSLPERCVSIPTMKSLAGAIVFSSEPSQGLLADLTRRRIPHVLLSTACSSMKTNTVRADYARGAFELTEHLIQLGHRQILPLVDESLGAVADEFQRGYQTAMGRYGVTPAPVVRCDRQAIKLEDILTDQPTALVCLGGQLSANIKNAVESSDRIDSESLSIVAMGQPGEIEPQQYGITSYDVYPDQMLDWAIELLLSSGPGIQPREVIVPGVFNDRGSTRKGSEQTASAKQVSYAVL